MCPQRAPRRGGRTDQEDLSAPWGEFVAVAIGGNIGPREAILARFRAAIRLIGSSGAYDLRCSSVYASVAAGPVSDQPPFLNAVIAFRMPMEREPRDLLLDLWAIERALGRRRPSRPRMGPRPIDLDLIRWGDRRSSSPLLTLPHPRMDERPFVLRPLAELFGPASDGDPTEDETCRIVAPPSDLMRPAS